MTTSNHQRGRSSLVALCMYMVSSVCLVSFQWQLTARKEAFQCTRRRPPCILLKEEWITWALALSSGGRHVLEFRPQIAGRDSNLETLKRRDRRLLVFVFWLILHGRICSLQFTAPQLKACSTLCRRWGSLLCSRRDEGSVPSASCFRQGQVPQELLLRTTKSKGKQRRRKRRQLETTGYGP